MLRNGDSNNNSNNKFTRKIASTEHTKKVYEFYCVVQSALGIHRAMYLYIAAPCAHLRTRTHTFLRPAKISSHIFIRFVVASANADAGVCLRAAFVLRLTLQVNECVAVDKDVFVKFVFFPI